MKEKNYVNICKKCKSRNILFQIKNGKIYETACKDCGYIAPFNAIASQKEEQRDER